MQNLTKLSLKEAGIFRSKIIIKEISILYRIVSRKALKVPIPIEMSYSLKDIYLSFVILGHSLCKTDLFYLHSSFAYITVRDSILLGHC